ncbi:unnamed protein product [Alopecurus aequalis]
MDRNFWWPSKNRDRLCRRSDAQVGFRFAWHMTSNPGGPRGPSQMHASHSHDAEIDVNLGTADMDTGAPTGQTLSSAESGSDGEVQSTPEGFVAKTPYLGMIFETPELALQHYNRYAKHVGFSVKISSSRRAVADNEKDKALYICNKAGKNKEAESEAQPQKTRLRTFTVLTDCKAKMRVKRMGANWRVTQFVEEQTHDLIKKFALKKYLRSHRKIPREERKFIDLLHDVNLSAGRIMQIMAELYGSLSNVPYDSKSISNYTAKLGEGHRIRDVKQLLDHFEELKKEDPGFYYKYKLDDNDCVENIFWVDGPAREVYKKYHDCISFDTTYMTNMYNMSCAPFIGINRYGQSIQLGCAFIRNERIPNFAWIFETFLDAMDGLVPLNIITDQDQAMRTAILVIFIGVCHRNCRWHIMQKFQEKVGTYVSKHEQLRRDFNEIVDYSLSKEEFEGRWAEMVHKHGIADNKHFADLYDIRELFVPAYFLHQFFPFLQTTARSEGFNAVLKKYVNPHDSLMRFFKQYMKLQEKIDVAEDANEFVEEDKTMRVWSDYPMEQQILETYTLPIYRTFQIELRKNISYNICDHGGSVYEVYPVQGSVLGYGKRSYFVDVDLPNGIYNCQCCKINRDGIFCCHVLKVMIHLGEVHSIPDHYILPRWCIPPPDVVVSDDEPIPVVQTGTGKLSRKDMRLLRYGNLCSDFKRIAVGAAASEKTNEVAEKHMRALEKELARMKKAAADALNKKKLKKAATASEQVQTDEGSVAASNSRVKDPPVTASRGRPAQKRKKGGLQLQAKKPTVCSVCKSTEHDARNCSVRLADPERYPLLSLFQ